MKQLRRITEQARAAEVSSRPRTDPAPAQRPLRTYPARDPRRHLCCRTSDAPSPIELVERGRKRALGERKVLVFGRPSPRRAGGDRDEENMDMNTTDNVRRPPEVPGWLLPWNARWPVDLEQWYASSGQTIHVRRLVPGNRVSTVKPANPAVRLRKHDQSCISYLFSRGLRGARQTDAQCAPMPGSGDAGPLAGAEPVPLNRPSSSTGTPPTAQFLRDILRCQDSKSRAIPAAGPSDHATTNGPGSTCASPVAATDADRRHATHPPAIAVREPREARTKRAWHPSSPIRPWIAAETGLFSARSFHVSAAAPPAFRVRRHRRRRFLVHVDGNTAGWWSITGVARCSAGAGGLPGWAAGSNRLRACSSRTSDPAPGTDLRELSRTGRDRDGQRAIAAGKRSRTSR